MIRIVDAWKGRHPEVQALAQIGATDLDPSHLEARRFIPPDEFDRIVRGADVVIGHAGMGTILTAVAANKPLLVFPRRFALRETRNDHQIATARVMSERGIVTMALEEGDLERQLDRLDELRPPAPQPSQQLESLRDHLRRFVGKGSEL